MFKVKVSLLYFLLIVLSVVALSLTVGKGRNEAIRLAEQSFEAFPAQFEAYRELRERRLEEFARHVARADVAAAATAGIDTQKAVTDAALAAAVGDARKSLVDQATAPDVVLVFDAHGVGVSAFGRPAWTGSVGLAEAVLRVRPRAPAAGGDSHTYFDVLKLPDHGETEFIVAIVPMAGATGEFGGAVLVGRALSKTLAAAEQKLFDRDVTYVIDDRAIVSTLDESRFQFMLASAKVADRLKAHLVSNDDLLGVSVPFARSTAAATHSAAEAAAAPTTFGDNVYGARYSQLRVILATPMARFDGAFESLTTLVPVVGGITFLIGVLLFGVLIRNYTDPLHKIDAGIHEVINGNLDHHFPFDYSDELAASMAQNLNVMMSVLLGKPMPDTSSAAPGGGAVATAGAASVAAGTGELVVADVSEPGSPELLAEAADTYFRRLFDEYSKARAAAGTPDAQMTYVRFVEQLVSRERRVKEVRGDKHVRFRVETRSGAVVLVPLTFV